MRQELTYANVMSTLAVILALSGGATAVAISLGKGSVGTKEIAKRAVKAQELGPVVVRHGSGPGISQGIVNCHKGERLLSGGGTVVPNGGEAKLKSSEPLGNGWKAVGEGAGSAPVTVTAHALCLRK